MPIVTASMDRCKAAIFNGNYAACDPDLTWWEWFNRGGYHSALDCDESRKQYFACLAAGIPASPAPAPPPISTGTAANNDPTLPEQVDDATRQRFEEWKQVLSSYFGGAVDSNGTPVDDSSGLNWKYLALGAAGLAAVVLLLGRRR